MCSLSWKKMALLKTSYRSMDHSSYNPHWLNSMEQVNTIITCKDCIRRAHHVADRQHTFTKFVYMQHTSSTLRPAPHSATIGWQLTHEGRQQATLSLPLPPPRQARAQETLFTLPMRPQWTWLIRRPTHSANRMASGKNLCLTYSTLQRTINWI
jgi:hypothetical protein